MGEAALDKEHLERLLRWTLAVDKRDFPQLAVLCHEMGCASIPSRSMARLR
ncbi:MAG: hypothetical protein WBV82_22140 [Myxococcaceae bacterium]